jgi:hypothetical protein
MTDTETHGGTTPRQIPTDRADVNADLTPPGGGRHRAHGLGA